MRDHWSHETRRHCVIPFEADPSAVADLRRAARLQLRTWDLRHLNEAVELAVTELATNVVKHVGHGSPATLLLDAGSERLRVEVHDTGQELPRCREAGPGDESGRGLSLVAAVTSSWFTMATPTGKAVCCEFVNADRPSRPEPGRERVARALTTMELYVLQFGGHNTRPVGSTPAREAAATDLITDLIFWLADQGCDPDDILDRAQTHYEALVVAAGHPPAPPASAATWRTPPGPIV